MVRTTQFTTTVVLASLITLGFLGMGAAARNAPNDDGTIAAPQFNLGQADIKGAKSKACRPQSVQQAQYGGWCCQHGWCRNGWWFYHCCKRWC